MVQVSDYVPVPKPLLDKVNFPMDIKGMSIADLKQLSYELRWETIEQVSRTGGHLSSSLGVTELTVALHYVFNAPEDKIVWDVAHQCYPHKMLTGRRSRFPTLRQWNGVSVLPRLGTLFPCAGAGVLGARAARCMQACAHAGFQQECAQCSDARANSDALRRCCVSVQASRGSPKERNPSTTVLERGTPRPRSAQPWACPSASS